MIVNVHFKKKMNVRFTISIYDYVHMEGQDCTVQPFTGNKSPNK